MTKRTTREQSDKQNADFNAVSDALDTAFCAVVDITTPSVEMTINAICSFLVDVAASHKVTPKQVQQCINHYFAQSNEEKGTN